MYFSFPKLTCESLLCLAFPRLLGALHEKLVRAVDKARLNGDPTGAMVLSGL